MFLFVPITLKTNILINHGICKTGFFHTNRPINRKLISTAIPTLLPHEQISTPRKTSEIREKQKKEVNFETGLEYYKFNGC